MQLGWHAYYFPNVMHLLATIKPTNPFYSFHIHVLCTNCIKLLLFFCLFFCCCFLDKTLVEHLDTDICLKIGCLTV